MRHIAIVLSVVLSGSVVASEIALIQGSWSTDGRAYSGFGFVINGQIISFPDRGCLNNQFKVTEQFEGNLTRWDGYQLGDHYSFIIKIDYANSSHECMNVKHRFGEYVRMSIPKDRTCYSSIYSYNDVEKLHKDKANNWDGNNISGWAGFSYTGSARQCQ